MPKKSIGKQRQRWQGKIELVAKTDQGRKEKMEKARAAEESPAAGLAGRPFTG